MHEKQGVVEYGRTPPEKPGKQLEDHVTKRAQDAVASEAIKNGLTEYQQFMGKRWVVTRK